MNVEWLAEKDSILKTGCALHVSDSFGLAQMDGGVHALHDLLSL